MAKFLKHSKRLVGRLLFGNWCALCGRWDYYGDFWSFQFDKTICIDCNARKNAVAQAIMSEMENG